MEINRNVQYRNIVGFGGAFTGAVSYLLEKLPLELQDHLYRYTINCYEIINIEFIERKLSSDPFTQRKALAGI